MAVKANLIVGMNLTKFKCLTIGLRPVQVSQWFAVLIPQIFFTPIHFSDKLLKDSFLNPVFFIPQTFSNE